MRLASDVCELTIYKTNGMKIHVGFSKGDFRYQVGNWLTMYAAKKLHDLQSSSLIFMIILHL